jgi:hypothetical protein
MVVRPASAGAALGMSSFGIWHRDTPFSFNCEFRVLLTTTHITA